MNDVILIAKILADTREAVPMRRDLARALGGIAEALFIQQLLYWSQRSADGWVFRTQQEIEEETCLTRRQQETARATLRALGVLIEERRGVPARLYYRIDEQRLYALLRAYHEGAGPDGASPDDDAASTNKFHKSAKLECTKAPNKHGANVQTNKEKEKEIEKREEGKPSACAERRDPDDAAPSEAEPPAPTPWSLFEAFCAELGADAAALPPGVRAKQCNHAKALLRRYGATVEDVRRITRYLRSQRWRTGPIDLATVLAEYDRWLLAGCPETAPARPSGRGAQALAELEAILSIARGE